MYNPPQSFATRVQNQRTATVDNIDPPLIFDLTLSPKKSPLEVGYRVKPLLFPGLPCRDARLVAFGVGQHPPGRRELAGDESSARSDRCSDSGLRFVVRHAHVNVNAIALGTRHVHLLEPERRAVP